MNLKVIKKYVDRYSLEEVNVGTILYDVPEERAKCLIGEGVAIEASAADISTDPEILADAGIASE